MSLHTIVPIMVLFDLSCAIFIGVVLTRLPLKKQLPGFPDRVQPTWRLLIESLGAPVFEEFFCRFVLFGLPIRLLRDQKYFFLFFFLNLLVFVGGEIWGRFKLCKVNPGWGSVVSLWNGVLFTLVYLEFGLVASIAVHYLHNLFSILPTHFVLKKNVAASIA